MDARKHVGLAAMSSTEVDQLRAEVERLRARVQLLEGVARLNAETIRSMQRAAEATADAIRAERTNNRGSRYTVG